jgi:putative transposase
MNHKKLRRIYAEERLQVRGSGRKRALPQAANQRWSLDFASDALADGRRFRILAIVDDFSRECLCLVADTSAPISRRMERFGRIIIEPMVGGLHHRCTRI